MSQQSVRPSMVPTSWRHGIRAFRLWTRRNTEVVVCNPNQEVARRFVRAADNDFLRLLLRRRTLDAIFQATPDNHSQITIVNLQKYGTQ